MRARRWTRAAGAWGHLLLVAVLALGVFAMHTTGHPEGGSGMSHAGAAPETMAGPTAGSGPKNPFGPEHTAGWENTAAVASVAVPADASGTAAEGPHGPGGGASALGPAVPGTDADPGPGSASHDSGMAMDMSTLCVAILGAWVVLALVRAALGRRATWLTALRGALIAAVRPQPPPPGPLLAELSILRI
ncbi:hypothetical protein [Streptomyces clavuligerus]|uniref:Uncharacterized protein n=2 Tax=Streptomyces clavuligerus TaxID=1901 RepID=B5H0A1_STRCL|nr:hypothetical protein [Streptomyces clavuligerus]ANW21446.1 hypothetical protein BB341_26160 [Streptomyces clavuligerus]AXU16079.1 hypothetical protein D1794_27185 [Streptomyces clavuligerus]EDY51997.1 hypothetical protein SSCG_05062 [Streptomyces clavuligerus]EFG05399.1 Hypothetical protein SCLAV_0323 [Streptomyces clavuligerus]MBY6306216.1 hypothetical protein [Streptomyces clavuligerus]